jgi:hypothetical protein
MKNEARSYYSDDAPITGWKGLADYRIGKDGTVYADRGIRSSAPHLHPTVIDHSPGGSPDPYSPVAPAPRYSVPTTYRPLKKVRRKGAPMDWAEALSRATAAVRLEMDRYSDADRDAAIAAVLDGLAEKVPGGYGSATFPPEWATMVRLRNLAANYRRSVDRASNRTDDIDEMSDDSFQLPGHLVTYGLDPEPVVSSDPYSAADRAADALDALGLDPTGDAFPMAYSAMRAATMDYAPDSDGKARETEAAETISAELGMTRAALRKAIQRGRDKVPSVAAGSRVVTIGETIQERAWFPRGEYGSALGLTSPHDGRSRSMPTVKPRDWQAIPAPVTYSTVPGGRRKWDASRLTDARKISGPEKVGPGRADWTYALTLRAHRRLTTAATMQRERLRKLTDAERQTRRAALNA